MSIGHCLHAALHLGSLQAHCLFVYEKESRYELVHKEKSHWKGFLLPTRNFSQTFRLTASVVIKASTETFSRYMPEPTGKPLNDISLSDIHRLTVVTNRLTQ